MYLALWLIRRWRLPATPALILPVAVIRKRFLAPDLVFSFGISHPCIARKSRPGMPGPGGFEEPRLLGHTLAESKDAPRLAARPAASASRMAGAMMRAPM